MNLRINETLQTGAVRKPPLLFSRLVGTVSNSAGRCGCKPHLPGDESVYLFLEITINASNQLDPSPDVVSLFQNTRFLVKRFYPPVFLLSNQCGVMQYQLAAEMQR